MNNRIKKQIQKEFANKNLKIYFNLLETRFKPEYDSLYIKEILKFTRNFNIRLNREDKLKFCNKCFTYLNSKTKEIRLNSENKCVEHICKNCGNTRRFKYK